MDLPASKAYTYLDFLTGFKPAPRIPDLKHAMVICCLRPKTDFLHFDLGLGSARFPLLLGLFIDKLTKVQDSTNGGIRIRCNFYQIHTSLLGNFERFTQWDDAVVIAVRANQAYFFNADTFIDPIV